MARRSPSDINLLFGVDKPLGCTSHDVVSRVRRALGERRVGHAGTLDPLASGVLVIGVGQATRLLGRVTLERKSYVARIVFGSETETDDAEGAPVRTAPVPPEVLDETAASRVLARTVGPQRQVPPAYSAISVGGVRSYRRAREGAAVELPARDIEVFDATLLRIVPDGDAPAWDVAFTVSKGAYIRALARDLGRSIGSAAHLGALSRTASGSVTLQACAPFDGLDPDRAREHALDPCDLLGLPRLELGSDRLDDVLCGRRLPGRLAAGVPGAGSGPVEVGIVIADELRAIAEATPRSIAMKQVYPQGIGGVRHDA